MNLSMTGGPEEAGRSRLRMSGAIRPRSRGRTRRRVRQPPRAQAISGLALRSGDVHRGTGRSSGLAGRTRARQPANERGLFLLRARSRPGAACAKIAQRARRGRAAHPIFFVGCGKRHIVDY
jgi:hypothetical protein